MPFPKSNKSKISKKDLIDQAVRKFKSVRGSAIPKNILKSHRSAK